MRALLSATALCLRDKGLRSRLPEKDETGPVHGPDFTIAVGKEGVDRGPETPRKKIKETCHAEKNADAPDAPGRR